MENYAQYQSYITPQNPKSLRRIIILGLLGFLVLVTIYVFFTYRILVVHTIGDSTGSVSLALSDQDGVEKSLGSTKVNSTKRVIIRKGKYVLLASSKMEASQQPVNAVGLGLHSIDSKLTKQKATTKIGSDGMGCSTIVSNIVYSFSCSSPSNVFRHTSLSVDNFSGKEPLLAQNQTLASNYQGGLLLLTIIVGESEISVPHYLNLNTGQMTPVSIPSSYVQKTPFDNETVTDIVTDNNPTSQIFGLVLYDNSILIYKNLVDTQPIRILPRYNKTGISKPSLLVSGYTITNGKLAVYTGKADTAVDSTAEEEGLKNYKQGLLDIYDVANLSKVERTINIDKSITADSVSVLGDSVILQGRAGIRVRTINQTSLDVETFHSKAENFAINTSRGSVITGDDTGVYEFSPKTNIANLLFRSDKARFSNLSSAGDSVVFNAFSKVNANDSISQIYKIDLNQPADYSGLAYKLPYSQTNLPIESMDFNGNLVVIKPLLSSLEFIGLPKPEYDQTEYDQVTAIILSRLRQDGITNDKFTIKFVI